MSASHVGATPSGEATFDLVRQLAMQSVLQLPQQDEEIEGRAPAPDASQVEALLNSLTPEQRERVYNIAGRRLALQLLYELDLSSGWDGSGGGGTGGSAGKSGSNGGRAHGEASVVLAQLALVEDLGPFHAERVNGMVTGAWAQRSTADAAHMLIAPEWPTYRLAAIDRAILRLGHFEGTSKVTPARIVIHECVELARAFGTDKSPAFVNALLDKALQAALAEQSA